MVLSCLFTNGWVKLVGQIASFVIMLLDAYENKQECKHWLLTHGDEMKRQMEIWIGDNAHADTRARQGGWEGKGSIIIGK